MDKHVTMPFEVSDNEEVWRNSEDQEQVLFHITDADGEAVAWMPWDPCMPDEQAKQSARANFIVRACNSHDALVAALDGLFEHCAMIHKHWGDGDNTQAANAAQDAARAALKLARGEG